MAPHPSPLRIAIVGFGNFGQFLAKRFVEQGHLVFGTSRGDYTLKARELGASFVPAVEDLPDCRPDVVIFCTSITSLRSVMLKYPLQR